MRDGMRFTLLCSLVAVFLLAIPDSFAQKDPYVGAGIGQLEYDASSSFSNLDFSYDESGTAFKLYTGSKWSEYFGAEVALMGSSSTSGDFLEQDQIQGVSVDDELELRDFVTTVDAMGYIPIGDRFELFGRLGGAFVARTGEYTVSGGGLTRSTDISSTGYGLSYGIGGNFNVNERFSIRADLQWIDVQSKAEFDSNYDDTEFDMRYVFVGAHYNF